MSAVAVIAVRSLDTGKIKRRSQGSAPGEVSGPVSVLTELEGEAPEGCDLIGCGDDLELIPEELRVNVVVVDGPIPMPGQRVVVAVPS